MSTEIAWNALLAVIERPGIMIVQIEPLDMSVEYDGLKFDRLGHASVRIESDDLVVYIDPWSDVIDTGPKDADVVFITHDDFDHYDPDGIEAVSNDDTVIVAYEEVDTADLDRPVETINYEGKLTVAGIDVRAVPAYNDPEGEHVREPGDPFHAMGEVVGLHLTFDRVTVYFTSDTDFLDELADIQANVLIPPIGGHYTMDRHEAADFAERIGADLVLPVHYDTFDAIETDADAFLEDVEGRGLAAELF